ncbi:MAG: cytochrome c [Methylococcaceae bacterium]|nr:cytochrome c [Methylococcaceae bacterium]
MLTVKPFWCAVALMFVCANVTAQLKTDKTVIDSNSGAATISVSFSRLVQGDLYLATAVDGELYFFGDAGRNYTKTVTPYTQNANFFADKVVLKLDSNGVPPAVYSLYQVVTPVGKSPLNVNNWLGGLSELKLSVNLPVEPASILPFSPPTVTPSPVPSSEPTPAPAIPTLSPTPVPVVECTLPEASFLQLAKDDKDDSETKADACSSTSADTDPLALLAAGKALYKSKGCSGCHGINPKPNAYNILKGKDPLAVREAINKNKGSMGFLKGISDADLQAIAAYLKTF